MSTNGWRHVCNVPANQLHLHAPGGGGGGGVCVCVCVCVCVKVQDLERDQEYIRDGGKYACSLEAGD